MLTWTALLACVALASAELEVVNQWNLFDFDLPYNYPTNPNYSTSQSPMTGLEVGWDRLFLSVPRFMPGAPLSLAFIPRNQPGGYGELSPKLQPYPSWDWHRDAAAAEVGGDNCTGLVSVFRVRLDRCNRLWVLDSGVMDSLVNFRVACPPKILIFDLANDNLVRSITLPPEVLRPNTLLTNLVLDDQNLEGAPGVGYGSCDNVFVYMSDTTNPGLVVYDARRDSAWRLGNPACFPETDWGVFRLAGEYFTLMDGVIGLALSAPGPDRTLYFQAFASNRLYSIPTSALKSGPNSGDDSDLPVSLVGHKSSQAAPVAVDLNDGSLVFAPVSETALAAWTPGASNHRVLAHDPEQLQFVLDINSAERDSGTLWIISTRLQRFLRKTISANEVNLRIMKVVPDLAPAPHGRRPGPAPLAPLAPSPYANFLNYKK